MRKRNDKLKMEQDLMIELDPEIAEIFKASTSVSGKYPLQAHLAIPFNIFF